MPLSRADMDSATDFALWEGRPAVVLSDSRAFVRTSEGAWEPVSAADVLDSASAMSEADWRNAFEASVPESP